MNSKTIAVVVALTAGSAMAEPVALFVGQSIQVTPEEAQAFVAVCAAEYAKVCGEQIVPVERAEAAYLESHDAMSAARATGAREYVVFDLVRLSPRRTVVTATRSDSTGAVRHRADLDLASLEDAPSVCNRLAHAGLEGLSTEQTRDRYNVTQVEEHTSGASARTHAERRPGFKFGFGKPIGSTTDFTPSGSLSAVLFMEHDRYFFELGAGFLIPGASQSGTSVGYGGLISELGASYYLTNGNVAPFVGGGVLPRLIFSGSALNLAPYAQFGVMVSRESANRFFAEARAAANLMPVTSNGDQPVELTLNAGMTF